ncbi:oligopeptide transport system substrate-binding protein [Butyrivibrio fibrisolvens]|uniref:Oligopeptide transport system substrate-binding protein n=1 Tax=Butyrivibrio fibrisolvens TaxID=831 RepID=A0A1H9VBX6_BUTFI|nr:ABC transporter substrate-binding protein [Butyrivibrio fibrisolvens]SES18944.1 oligopeptide transport system substrate-binding protein [Butyrivibrio fibrisolvens]
MKRSKVVALLLTAGMTVSSVACGGSGNTTENTGSDNTQQTSGTENTDGKTTDGETGESTDEAVDESSMDYDELSEYVYNQILGEFYETYEAAQAEEDKNVAWALDAVAEAKLLESGVFIPFSSRGGMYAISRIAPYTVCPTLWGNDESRYHNAVVTSELIKAEDYMAMREKYAELKGTGEYESWVKSFLEEKGYTITDEYKYPSSSDPTTWDVLSTSRQADTRALVHTYDGLMEYDGEGTQQPALATDYEVSDDGLTYTFHIREGVKWVDSQGREVGDVTADDFVAGMQHMMDAMGGLEYLVQDVIVGADAYINGETTDFSTVGVKAVDDYTLEYDLVAPCTYFNTMLSYSVFAPLNRSYYESCGGKFGDEFDSSASDYTYGTDADHIAYCGPYLITNFTAKNTITFKANSTYWNKDNINIQTIYFLYNDGTDATKAYNDAKAGTISGCTLSTAALEAAKNDGLYDDYAYISLTDATSFVGFMNVNRAAFANTNDATAAKSTQTEEDAARTKAAMRNQEFRLALLQSIDRGTYNAQTNGDDLKYNSLINTYTPGNFVQLEEDVTIAINGTDTTFPAGTYYGEIVQAQLDADGVNAKVWDPEANDGLGSSSGFDGWYNKDAAVEHLNKAVEELAAQGVEVSAENPILVDYPYFEASEVYANRANAFKKSVEDALGGAVVVNLVACATSDDWYYAGYYTDLGSDANYDIYDVSGWGPDYGDPKTYLDTMLPDYAGYMVKCFGIY